MLQGLGTALILAVVAQVRDRDEQTRAVASAEVRTLQARMNSHFLFNPLNALAALATVAPRELPRATGGLCQFLRASLDQQERVLVPLEEDLAVVRAYLDIESLRFGARLKAEETIDLGFVEGSNATVLVPTAGRERDPGGLRSLPQAGRLRLVAPPAGEWLELSVSDDGQGVPSTGVEHRFFAERPRVHALVWPRHNYLQRRELASQSADEMPIT